MQIIDDGGSSLENQNNEIRGNKKILEKLELANSANN
jgi:hypothetical protein